MKDDALAVLRGVTWKHDRGLAPMLATAARFRDQHPEVSIEWEARSLKDFGDTPLDVLADRYDLIVLDHPFIGTIAQKRCFLALDEYLSADKLNEMEADSIGGSYSSYKMGGHLWALPIDAAAQVSGFRIDLLKSEGFDIPGTWDEVFEIARFRPGFVSVALSPVDSLMCFFSLCANSGEPPFVCKDGTLVSRERGEFALNFLRQLAKHSLPDALSSNPIAIWERMSSSDEIAYCPLAFGYSNYSRSGYRANLLSFGAIPSSGFGSIGATLGGAGLAISASCSFRELAVEYASWVAGPKCQRTLYVESGGQPGSRSAWRDLAANVLTGGYFFATLQVLERAWVRPRYAGFVNLQTEAAALINQFLGDRLSSRKTLEELNRIFQNSRVRSDVFVNPNAEPQ
jgi:multiple sugar transport system substrate-binding protein